MSGLPERLARDFMAREKHNEMCEDALVDLVRLALNEAANVSRDGVSALRKRSVEYEAHGASAMGLIFYARADERCDVAAAIEALK